MWDTDDEDPILTRKLPFIKVIKNSVVQQKGSNDVKIFINLLMYLLSLI